MYSLYLKIQKIYLFLAQPIFLAHETLWNKNPLAFIFTSLFFISLFRTNTSVYSKQNLSWLSVGFFLNYRLWFVESKASVIRVLEKNRKKTVAPVALPPLLSSSVSKYMCVCMWFCTRVCCKEVKPIDGSFIRESLSLFLLSKTLHLVT